MNSKHTILVLVWIGVILDNPSACGQPTGIPRTVTPAVAAPGSPAITILAAATGALLRSQGAANASLDLGPVSYFTGTTSPGSSSRKNSRSLMVSTRFALKIDCPGSMASSKVNVTMSRLDAADSHAIRIDGITLGLTEQSLAQFMTCGSAAEHRLDMEVPVSTPAGWIASTIMFVAMFNR